MVLARQTLGSDAGGLEIETRPLPLMTPPLDGVRVAGLNFNRLAPQIIIDLDRKHFNIFSYLLHVDMFFFSLSQELF